MSLTLRGMQNFREPPSAAAWRVLLLLWALLSFSPATPAEPTIEPHVRPSLADIGKRLKNPDAISSLYRDSLKNPATLTAKKVKDLEKPNLALMKEFRHLSTEMVTFARGEIEDEAVLSRLVSFLQLSLLRIRLWSEEKPLKASLGRIKEEANAWFQFAAELPYNEASLVGLRVTGVIRSLLIDELEALEKKQGDGMAKDELWLNWLMQLRTPWPVDRMILSEARRVLSPATMPIAEKVAGRIQKDPYLSVEDALKKIPGAKPGETEVLKSLWRKQDMDAMKTEINRLQTLRLRLASRLFRHREGRWPKEVAELVKARLLLASPVDYFTGRPMQLPQLDKPEEAAKSP